MYFTVKKGIDAIVIPCNKLRVWPSEFIRIKTTRDLRFEENDQLNPFKNDIHYPIESIREILNEGDGDLFKVFSRDGWYIFINCNHIIQN